MWRSTVLMAGLLTGLLVTNVVYAQQEKAKGKGRPGVAGVIQSVNEKDKSIVIKGGGKTAGEQTIYYTDETKFVVVTADGNKEGSAKDLRADVFIKVQIERKEDKNYAKQVVIRAPRKKK
ncbi:MAG: hypothetical protein C4297_06130 [Gemmataceae bacterium]|mgnify:FL=1